MCGLFGAHSTTLSDNEVGNVKLLAHLSGLRGMDSTGVILASRFKKGFRVYTDKETIDPCTFFRERDPIKTAVSTVVGHCRYATHGSVSWKNAHPFHFGKIVGVHNGVIHKLAPGKDQDRTDSSVLYEKINEMGLVPALEEARDGAYALAWVNVQENTLNFVRNEQRQLWFMRAKCNTLYWASEKRMLDFLRANATSSYDEPWLLKSNVLLTYPLGSMAHRLTENVLPARVYKPDPPKEHPFISEWCPNCTRAKRFCQCGGGKETSVPLLPFLPDGKKSSTSGGKTLNRYHYEGQEWNLCSQCWKEEDECTCPGEFTHVRNMPSNDTSGASSEGVKELYAGFNNRTMSIPEAERALEIGCANCNHIPDVTEEVVWTEHDTFFCKRKECQEMSDQCYHPGHPRFKSEIVEID